MNLNKLNKASDITEEDVNYIIECDFSQKDKVLRSILQVFNFYATDENGTRYLGYYADGQGWNKKINFCFSNKPTQEKLERLKL